jgi:hypothetical protein
MTRHESSESPPGGLRTLSAADTEIRKVFVLGFGTLWVVLASIAAFASSDVGVLLFPAAGVIVTGLVGWQALRLKEVETDGRDLFVSTMSRTMRLPLSWVESIDSSGWPFSATVTVGFRQVTPFGSEIVFRPRGSWVPFSSGRAAAEELRVIVARARAEGQPGSVFRAGEGQTELGRS